MKELFLFISTFFALITPFVGILSIYQGEYKPQRTTRFLFLFVTALFVITIIAQGKSEGLVLAFIQFLLAATIFILSIKYGVGGKSKLDLIVLIFAITAIFLWKISSNPTIGLIFLILSDIAAFSPTLIKSYKEPYTESWKFYLCDVFAGLFSILAISEYELKNYIFPFYILIINLLIALIILSRRRVLK